MSMKNKLILSNLFFLSLLLVTSCQTSNAERDIKRWKIVFCVDLDSYVASGKYTLLKTGVEITDQEEIASCLALLDSASASNKQVRGHFCGAETFQVFESNNVPVFVTSVSGCGHTTLDKIIQVDKFNYGYYLGKTEWTAFECLPYCEYCHRFFEDSVISSPESVVGEYVRNRKLSQISRHRCSWREGDDETDR